VKIPNVPTDVPSTLLERRPDIAAAERESPPPMWGLAVARAAFYPDISLQRWPGSRTPAAILCSPRPTPSGPWAHGGKTLFDNGRTRAKLAVAKAANADAAAAYRGTVLKAFQEVEDQSGFAEPAGRAASERATSVQAPPIPRICTGAFYPMAHSASWMWLWPRHCA